MTTSEEKFKVLKMVEEGKITAEEGEKLLNVLEKTSAHTHGAAAGEESSIRPGKWLRIKVSDVATGRVRVNIRLPISLINSGIKLGMKFAPEIEGINAVQLMDAMRSGGVGKIMDVIDDEDDEHVEIWVE